MLNKESRMSRAAVAVLAALMAVVLVGCSGSGPSTTGPSALVPDSSASMVVLSQTFEDVEAGSQRVVNFTLPRRGTLALTVRWKDQNNSVIAVLTGAGCFNFQNPVADCQVRRSVERQGKEGREEFIDYPDAAGAYRLVLENQGPGTESIRVTADLTSTSVAPAPPTPRPTDRPERERPNPRGSGQP